MDQKCTNILILTDAYSRYVDAFCMRDQKAHTVAANLVEYITRYGHIENLHSDRGVQFMSEVVKELTESFGVKRLFTTSYAPWSELSERYIQTVKRALSVYCSKHSDWS